MLRTIGLLIFEVFDLLYTVRLLPRCRRMQREGDTAGVRHLIEGLALRWATVLLRHVRADVEVTGRENLPDGETPVIFVANHQSYFDIPLMTANIGCPRPFIAKDGVKKIPLVRTWMQAWGCVFVERGDARAAAAAFRDAAKTVQNGNGLIIFAEGTRSRDGELQEFKAGSFRIAQHAKVPVVPCCIDGTGLFFERNGSRVNRASRLRLRILPMIDTADYTRDDWKALPELCRGQIAEALEEMRSEK